MGVTGARDSVAAAAPELVARCRPHTDLPIGVGLGVRSGDQAAEVAAFADGVIVGSAFVTAAERGRRGRGARAGRRAGRRGPPAPAAGRQPQPA